MSTNQKIILDTLLEQQKNELGNDTLSNDDFFHLFVTEQVLKNLELSYDEIMEGIVDNGGDGGIDAIYTFVNSELVQRDSILVDGKRNSVIDVYILQSKNTTGFGESAIEKCTSSANDLFDLSKSSDSLRTVYNNELLANREVFKNQYLHLISKFPVLHFHYFYASKGIEVHRNVERKVEGLVETIKRHFDKAIVSFSFLTASELINLSRKEQIKTKGITLTDNPISTQDGGYIALVPLKNYFDFITDENDEIIKYFFDSNIRDYQGSVEVNSGIKNTLNSTNSPEDFWWLNNGVTITVTNASFSSKVLQVEEPQIVNGLQTSFELYNFFKINPSIDDSRNVLIRIVKTSDEKSRLKVIKSTNSQTNIPPASLRATDPIHRDIEDYLLSKGYYYDRRKNYHKNQLRPINKIISIPYLAQLGMSTLQRKPDYARARPSTIIKNDTDYDKIFKDSVPIEVYYKLIFMQQKVEEQLNNHDSPKLNRAQKGDIKFHVLMYVVCTLCNNTSPTSEKINNINLDELNAEILKRAVDNTVVVYESMGGNDGVAKGKEFVNELIDVIRDEEIQLA